VGERVEVDLQHLVVAEVAHRLELLLVTPDQRRGDVARRLDGELLLQDLGPQLLPPELVRRRQVRGALRVLAVERRTVVTFEREVPGAQQLRVERDLLAQPLEVAREDDVGRLGVALDARFLGQRRAQRPARPGTGREASPPAACRAGGGRAATGPRATPSPG
jgi:hypothetical protein